MQNQLIGLGDARQDCLEQCDAGADAVYARMWCKVTLGEARHDGFSQWHAGADVVQPQLID